METGDQASECGLARPGWPDDGRDRSRRGGQIETVEHRNIPVAEAHRVDRDLWRTCRRCDRLGGFRQPRLVEQIDYLVEFAIHAP